MGNPPQGIRGGLGIPWPACHGDHLLILLIRCSDPSYSIPPPTDVSSEGGVAWSGVARLSYCGPVGQLLRCR